MPIPPEKMSVLWESVLWDGHLARLSYFCKRSNICEIIVGWASCPSLYLIYLQNSLTTLAVAISVELLTFLDLRVSTFSLQSAIKKAPVIKQEPSN